MGFDDKSKLLKFYPKHQNIFFQPFFGYGGEPEVSRLYSLRVTENVNKKAFTSILLGF